MQQRAIGAWRSPLRSKLPKPRLRLRAQLPPHSSSRASSSRRRAAPKARLMALPVRGPPGEHLLQRLRRQKRILRRPQNHPRPQTRRPPVKWHCFRTRHPGRLLFGSIPFPAPAHACLTQTIRLSSPLQETPPSPRRMSPGTSDFPTTSTEALCRLRATSWSPRRAVSSLHAALR